MRFDVAGCQQQCKDEDDDMRSSSEGAVTLRVKPWKLMYVIYSLLTCEMALNALVRPSFSPPLDTDSAEWMAVLAASSTPSLIFFPMSVRLTSSRPYGQNTNRCTHAK